MCPLKFISFFEFEFVLRDKVRSNLIGTLGVAEFLNTSLGPGLW